MTISFKNRFSRETVSMEFDSRLEIRCRPEYYFILTRLKVETFKIGIPLT